MSKIIRTPTKVAGGITAEEREKMRELSNLWISRAYRTAPIEPDKIVPAILGIYRTAGLKDPRVVIVPSPRVMAFAGGFAAAIWHLRKNATHAATHAATDAATHAATRAATHDATHAATRAATYAATHAATDAATHAATRAATDAATRAATRDATYDATYDATDDATCDATDDATRAATYDATDATDAATYDATDAATHAATRAATYDATDAATDAATYDATYDATRAATYDATRAATHDATHDATHAATDAAHAATHAATDAATRDATYDATRDATRAATYAATDAATRAATHDATYAATHDAVPPAGEPRLVKFFLMCAQRWSAMYQGGNMWAAWTCYLGAYRDVLGLRLPVHEKFAPYEAAAIHGGFRIMHEEFCMVSDFPEIIKVDAEHRPHCEDGPSHRWRDGWSLYHWHGIRTTEQVIMRPETITAEQVQAEENAELRRVMVERMGWERYCQQAQMRLVHSDHLDTKFPILPVSALVDNGSRLVTEFRSGREVAELLEADGLRDFEDRPMRFVRLTDPSTGRQYVLRVQHDHKRCYEAVGWTFGMSEKEYKSSAYLRQGDIGLVPLKPSTLSQQQHS